MASGLIKHYEDVRQELRRWIGGEYPSFVLSGIGKKNAPTLCPVFVFHKITVDTFEPMLRYLQANGYETVTMKDYMAWCRGDLFLSEKHLLLTFDDGRASQWTIAEPMLEKYGFKGVLFAIPEFISEGAARAQWRAEAAKDEVNKLESFDDGDSPLMNSSEIKAMHERGFIEVESHSMKHYRVFIGPEVVDFWRPELAVQQNLDYEFPSLLIEGKDAWLRSRPWGTPIYRSAPRFSGLKRYLDSEKIRRLSSAYVDLHGGEAFFEQKGWRQLLIKTVEPLLKEHPGEWEDIEQQRAEILADLLLAKKTLEQLLGKKVKHLCLPWGAGSQTVVDLAAEAGYESVSWTNSTNYKNKKDLLHIKRLKNDLIWRLPGEGRWSIQKVFWRRIQRRFNHEMDY